MPDARGGKRTSPSPAQVLGSTTPAVGDCAARVFSEASPNAKRVRLAAQDLHPAGGIFTNEEPGAFSGTDVALSEKRGTAWLPSLSWLLSAECTTCNQVAYASQPPTSAPKKE